MEYRAHIRERLEGLVQRIAGIQYRVADVREEIELAVLQPDAFLYVNLPGYRGGYAKMFGDAEGCLSWNKTVTSELDPKESRGLLDRLTGFSCTALAYVHHGLDAMPDGWTVLFATPVGKERTDYLVANRDLPDRYAALRIEDKPAKVYPIYDDEEITPQSHVTFLPTDKPTALYYRDLFVHRLGTTDACRFYLMAIDGRITTALGLNDQYLLLGKSDYLSETFGITKTATRYARLGKLFMLCLTSGDMRRFLAQTQRAYSLREPAGIQTTSITQHEEGKTDRSVMKLVSREALPAGGFRIVYRANFRDDTWGDCIQTWLERWGNKSRG